MGRRLLMVLAFATAVPGAFGQGKVSVKVQKDHVDFMIGDELATRYHTAGYAKPIFWPIYAPGKMPLTRNWPMDKSDPKEATDHVHQKSVWFSHGDVSADGLELKDPKLKGCDGIDFWSEGKGERHGLIVCTHVGEPKISADSVQLPTRNEWRTGDGRKVLDETRVLTFYDLGKARLIVLDIDLHASVYPITFGDTKEGSMAIRIAQPLVEGTFGTGKGKLKNADGKTGELAIWGRTSAWCDYSGPIDGKMVGLAILSDPKNIVPACWHSRGYGLMAANPFGRDQSGFPEMRGKTDLVRLAKGGHLRLRYGVLAHEGDTDVGRVGEYYQRFVQGK